VEAKNWRRLAAAVLVQATLDAQEGDPKLAAPARRWLAGEGVSMAEMLDIPQEQVTAWVDNLPTLPWEQLTLFDS